MGERIYLEKSNASLIRGDPYSFSFSSHLLHFSLLLLGGKKKKDFMGEKEGKNTDCLN